MSRILKRPMFRIGGSANDGIMSMAAPRKNYEEGSPGIDERFKKNIEFFEKAAGPGRSERNRLMDLLLEGSLALGAGAGAGKKLPQALALSFREPAQRYMKSGQEEEAAQRQLRLAAATQAISSDEAERLARLKIKQGYEAQTFEAQVKSYADTLKESNVDIIKNRRGDLATDVVQFRRNNPGVKFIGIPNIELDSKGLPAYRLNTIPEGSIFLDPIDNQFKKRITKGVDPVTNKPIFGTIFIDKDGKEITQKNLKDQDIKPAQPQNFQKKGTINVNPYRLG